jgi:hypothetical protein
MVTGPVHLGRTSWWQDCVAEELPHPMVDRKQGLSESGITFSGTPLVTYFLQLGPTS